MKKTACMVLTAFMFISTAFSNAAHAGYLIQEKVNSQTLAKGVECKSIFRFSEDGMAKINIVEVDLSSDNIGFDVLFNEDQGFARRQKLSNMVSKRDDVIAAINGDFFSMSNPSFSLGAMVRNGKILSNPYYEEQKYASVVIDDSKNVIMEYLSPNVNAVNATRSVSVPVAAVNKPSQYYANIVAYTTEYVRNSPGANDTYYDLCEVVVDSGTVTDVRYGQPPVAIPQNGYVLVAGGNNGLILRDSFQAGESVQLSANANLDFPKIQAAMGAGSVIIKNGQITTLTQKVAGKAQRTALGVTNENKLIMLTVDGRLSKYPGMEPEEVATYMLGIGCRDAVILDGGGSTELIANGRIRNTLVGGAERELLNGFAVKTSVQAGPLDHMKIYSDKQIMYAGDSAQLDVSFFDADENPIKIGASNVYFEASGISGTFSNGKFTAASGGKGRITAYYGDESASVEVEVIQKTNSDSQKIDKMDEDEMEDGITIAFLGDMSVSKKRLIDNIILQRYEKEIKELESSNVVMIGNANTAVSGALSNNLIDIQGGGYTSRVIGDDTVVASLDNSTGTLYKSAGQWKFINDLLESDYDNIVIALTSRSQLSVAEEAELFKSEIYSKAKDKNIYVLYRGSDFGQIVEGNARYISIPDYNDLHKGDYTNDYRYLVMNIDGKDIKYSYRNILEED